MHSSKDPNQKRNELERRVKSLEQQARLTFDILEMASTLGDFQTNINQLQEPDEILRETTQRIQGFIPFLATSYYLVDENTQDFNLTLCLPQERLEELREEVDYLIDNGVFSLALRENSPIHVHSRSGRQRLVLHSLSTSSRTRGMFVGLLGRTERTVSGLVLSLLSIILKNCANALESFELYRLFRENEQRYRELADFLPHLLFEINLDGTFRFMNQGTERLGMQPEEVRITRLQDLIVPEDCLLLETKMRDWLDYPQGFDINIKIVFKDGPREAILRMRPIVRDKGCCGWRGVLLMHTRQP